ncbi:MAG: glycosyltransferase, partial [Muribaculaceae bacterium]|nr:glycosyltransferase [Muribaculaceae bacterium]
MSATILDNPLVSVIIPIYNVEKYLEECVESVVNQTYSNLEIILSDDGSTDSSGAIADRLAATDIRIHVIHEENGGSSVARNRGLDIAKGEYVMFVDSDDTVSLDIVERLLGIMIETDTDIVISRHPTNVHGQFIEMKNPEDVNVYSREEIVRLFLERKIPSSACLRLCSQSLIGETRFVPRLFNEDAVFTVDLLAKVERVAYIDRVLYYYRPNEASRTNNFSTKFFDRYSNALRIDEKIAALPFDTTVERRHYRMEMAIDCILP